MLDSVKKTFSAVFLSRQELLKQQIVEALDLKSLEKLFFLQTQWAHRYGVETLPENLQNQNLSDLELLYERDLSQKPKISEESIERNTKLSDLTVKKDSSMEEETCPIKKDKDNSITTSEALPNTNFRESTNIINQVSVTNKIEDVEVKTSVDLSGFPPPPRPTLKRFRRWLPDFDKEIPKAS